MADDISQGLQGFADFQGDEFGGLVAFQRGPCRQQALGAALKGRLVPGIDGDGMIRSQRACGGVRP